MRRAKSRVAGVANVPPYPSAASVAGRVARSAFQPPEQAESDAAGEAASLSTSERLLDAAAKLFWAKGYASTTTREIAEVLGVRKASLYHHISSKEDLLFEISVSSLDHITRRVAVAVDAIADPVERVRTLVHAHVASMIADQDKHSVMLTELRALTPARRARIVEMRDAYERLVAGTLEGARAAGALRDDVPVKYLALSLLNLLNWSIFWFQRDGGLTPDRLADYLSTVYLSGACNSAEGSDLEPGPAARPREFADERLHRS